MHDDSPNHADQLAIYWRCSAVIHCHDLHSFQLQCSLWSYRVGSKDYPEVAELTTTTVASSFIPYSTVSSERSCYFRLVTSSLASMISRSIGLGKVQDAHLGLCEPSASVAIEKAPRREFNPITVVKRIVLSRLAPMAALLGRTSHLRSMRDPYP